jgi:hypothetical protein
VLVVQLLYPYQEGVIPFQECVGHGGLPMRWEDQAVAAQ